MESHRRWCRRGNRTDEVQDGRERSRSENPSDMSASDAQMEMLKQSLQAAFQANAVVVILVLLGVAATLKGVFDSRGISDLGRLVYHVSLPSLLFYNIMYEVTLDRLKELWVLPLFCTLHIFTGAAFSWTLSTLCGLETIERRATTATVTFGNAGALAIAVIVSLCECEPMKGIDNCRVQGVAYIAFYLITQNIWLFTFGQVLLFGGKKTPNPPELVSEEEQEEEEQGGDKEEEEGQEDSLPSELSNEAPSVVPIPSLMGGVGEQIPLTPRRGIEHFSLRRRSYDSRALGGSFVPRTFSHSHLGNLERLEHSVRPISRSVYGRMMTDHEEGGSISPRMHTNYAYERLTIPAIKDAASYLPLEVRAFLPEHHGFYGSSCDEDYEDSDFERYDTLTAPFVDERKPRRYLRLVRKGIKKVYKRTRGFISGLLKNPPLQAAILAMALGLVPSIKSAFVDSDGALHSVYMAINTLGRAQVPVSMLMLSGSGTLRYLEKVREKAELEAGIECVGFSFSWIAIAIMIFGRIIAMPLFGYFWLQLAEDLGIMPNSRLMMFVVLLESAVPSAQNVVMMLLVHGELAQGAAMAEIILWQYGFAVPCFTMCVAFFQYVSFGTTP